jgi:hypothetical protein
VLISNAFVQLGVGVEGAWGLSTTGGDPADSSDDLALTFSPTGNSNGLALELDGTPHVLNESSPEIVEAADGSYVTATWNVDGILLQARYELTENGSGRADTAKVTYTVTNPSVQASDKARSVSLKLLLDIECGNDSGYVRLLTPGGAVATETGFGQTRSGGAYALPVPDFWQGFQREGLADPGLVSQGTFKGGGATPPDKVVIGVWKTLEESTSFDYVPSAASVSDDSAVALWWFNRSVAPGAAVSFVVLYGVGQVSWGGTELVMGVSAPASLTVVGDAFVPNPFSVVVQLQNFGANELLNLPVTITLPAGLSVAVGGSATQFMASLGSGAYGLLAFRIAASPDYAGQTLDFSVSAGTGQPRASVDKTLVLPPAVDFHTITFSAGLHGSLIGTAVQARPHGGSTTAVTAVADLDYRFRQWSDGSTENPRMVTNVTADRTITAQYVPNGEFVARVTAAERGWWDLSGTYRLRVAENPLVLNLVHDALGRLTGNATYTVGEGTVVNLPVRGSVRGSAGNLVVKIALNGADPAKTVTVKLALALTLTPNAGLPQLTGPLTGRVTLAGTVTTVADPVELPIAAPKDGSWSLRLRLAPAGRGAVTGSATLTLAGPVDYDYAVRGRILGSTLVLDLAGSPADPLARGIAIRAVATTLEGNLAMLQAFSGKGYGQTLLW